MSKRETETEREGLGYRRGRAASSLMSYIIQTEANSKAGSTAAYANLRLRSLSQRSRMSRRIVQNTDEAAPQPSASFWALGPWRNTPFCRDS